MSYCEGRCSFGRIHSLVVKWRFGQILWLPRAVGALSLGDWDWIFAGVFPVYKRIRPGFRIWHSFTRSLWILALSLPNVLSRGPNSSPGGGPGRAGERVTAEVRRALERLPQDHRNAVVLKHLRGKNNKQTGELLEMPESKASTSAKSGRFSGLSSPGVWLRCAMVRTHLMSHTRPVSGGMSSLPYWGDFHCHQAPKILLRNLPLVAWTSDCNSVAR